MQESIRQQCHGLMQAINSSGVAFAEKHNKGERLYFVSKTWLLVFKCSNPSRNPQKNSELFYDGIGIFSQNPHLFLLH